MEGVPAFIPWIVPIRVEDRLLGTGFVVAEKTVVTCAHVLGAVEESDLKVGGTSSQTAGVIRTRRAADADLALLETDIAWPEHATLMIDPSVPESLPSEASILALGYDHRSAGQRLGFTRFTAKDLSRPEQRLSSYGTNMVSLFRAEGIIEQGFSGGPLALDDGKGPVVLGVNTLGGQQAPMASFIPVAAVAKLLFSAGITPRCAVTRADAPEPRISATNVQRKLAAERAERWRQMLGLPAASVGLTFRLSDGTHSERFVLLPPATTATQRSGHPLLVQESVARAGLLTGSALDEHAARGFSLRRVESFLAGLSAETRIPFRLLRSTEWLNAITAGGDETLPLCRPRSSQTAAAISCYTSKNSAGFRPPPLGCYEITLSDAAIGASRTSPVIACSSEASRNGTPISVHLGRDDHESSAVFRLAVPALSRLETLAPQWGDRWL